MALSDALEQRGGDADALIAAVEEEQGFGDAGAAEGADAAADDVDMEGAAAAHDDSWGGGGDAEAAGPDDGGWDADGLGADEGFDGFDGAEAGAAAETEVGNYAPETEAAAPAVYDAGGNGVADGSFGDGVAPAASAEHHGGEQGAQDWDAEGEWAAEQPEEQVGQTWPEQPAGEQLEPWRDGDENSVPAQHADQQSAEGATAIAGGPQADNGVASAAWAAEAAEAANSQQQGVQEVPQDAAQGDSPSWHTQPDQQPGQDAGEWGAEDDWGAAPVAEPAAASPVAPQRHSPAAPARPSRR
jgi:hypothetical protein